MLVVFIVYGRSVMEFVIIKSSLLLPVTPYKQRNFFSFKCESFFYCHTIVPIKFIAIHKATVCVQDPLSDCVWFSVVPFNIHGSSAAGTESCGIKTVGTTEMRKRASEFAARLFYCIILSAILFIFFYQVFAHFSPLSILIISSTLRFCAAQRTQKAFR